MTIEIADNQQWERGGNLGNGLVNGGKMCIVNFLRLIRARHVGTKNGEC